jgi:hypothetical protein
MAASPLSADSNLLKSWPLGLGQGGATIGYQYNRFLDDCDPRE